ncbi:MAG: transposase family protein, partial [Planctomycetales bacterium]|nr:transposase family protein [Planctomycetales bacterium]
MGFVAEVVGHAYGSGCDGLDEGTFGGVSDPRVPGRTLYPLMEVLVMAFVGVLCGGDDWEGIAAIAEEHES